VLLKSLKIAHFRAFGPAQTANFTLPDPSKAGSGLTIFVGPNNTGKSTIIGAICDLLSSDETFIAGQDDRRIDKAPVLEIMFENGNGQFKTSVKKRKNRAHMQKIGEYEEAVDRLVYLPSRRNWSDRFGINQQIDSSQHEKLFHQNARTNQFFVDSLFGSLIKRIDINQRKRNEFSKLLKKVKPTITEWFIDNDGEQDFVSFKTISGGSHRAGMLGDGVTNLFRIIYSIFSLKPGQILLLDEPELSLHPQCQRNLHQVLSEKSKVNQIILSTHSPYFISWGDLRRGCKVYRSNLRKNSGATIKEIKKTTLQKIISVADKDIKNRKLYDVVAKEIFFSRGCLFVEGQEDAHLISHYIEKYDRPFIEIFGYGSGGAGSILHWIEMANELGIRSAALFDNDQNGSNAYNIARNKYGKNRNVSLRKLPTKDIRDKPKLAANCRDELDEIEKEGIFKKDWVIKKEHKKYFEKTLDEFAGFLSRPWR